MRTTWTVVILTALIASTAGYQAAKQQLEPGQPIGFDAQLAQNGLVDENTMLLRDILEPVFGSAVRLMGVAQTNRCEAFDKGCAVADQAFTEAQRAASTTSGPHESLLRYTTDEPITQAELDDLHARLDTSPYRLTAPATSQTQPGVQPLFGFLVDAAVGGTAIRIVLIPGE